MPVSAKKGPCSLKTFNVIDRHDLTVDLEGVDSMVSRRHPGPLFWPRRMHVLWEVVDGTPQSVTHLEVSGPLVESEGGRQGFRRFVCERSRVRPGLEMAPEWALDVLVEVGAVAG